MATKKMYFLLSMLLSMLGAKAYAYDFEFINAEGVTIYYNYINDGTELEVTRKDNHISYSGSVVIPEEVIYMGKTRKVTSIGDYAFNQCRSLTSVTIPNSVTSIGGAAFCLCTSLTSVDIPNSVTSIGRSAFSDCYGLTSVTIPNSVTSIEYNAFTRCNLLTSVTIGNSVTSIGHEAFYNCSSLTSVTIGNSVTSIGFYAFTYCSSLTSVTIPNSVTSIGVSAFFGCSALTSVTIGSGTSDIYYNAFAKCKNLKNVYCYAENVPSTDARAFDNCPMEDATLHVPDASINLYKTTEPWKSFKEMVALTDSDPNPSGIFATEAPNDNKSIVYDLNGRVVTNSHKGINIILMDNGTTKKVVVK